MTEHREELANILKDKDKSPYSQNLHRKVNNWKDEKFFMNETRLQCEWFIVYSRFPLCSPNYFEREPKNCIWCRLHFEHKVTR